MNLSKAWVRALHGSAYDGSMSHPRAPSNTRRNVLLVAIVATIGVTAGLIGFAVVRSLTTAPPARVAPVRAAAPRFVAAPDPAPQPAAVATEAGRSASARPTSPGCGKEPEFRGLGKMRSNADLDPFEWFVFVPASYDSQTPAPVMLFFHNQGRDVAGMIDVAELDELAETEGVIIVAPQYADWTNGGRSVAARGPDAVSETAERMCLDPKRVFVASHGKSGELVDELACEGWVTAAATSAYRRARRHPPCTGAAPVPFLMFSPLLSPRIPVDGKSECTGVNRPSLQRHESAWLKNNRCQQESRKQHSTHKQSTCYTWDCEASFVSCHLHGGHAWPGSSIAPLDDAPCAALLAFPLIDFPGTRTMWEFFEAAPDNRETLW